MHGPPVWQVFGHRRQAQCRHIYVCRWLCLVPLTGTSRRPSGSPVGWKGPSLATAAFWGSIRPAYLLGVAYARYNREGYVRAMADEIAKCCDKFDEATDPVIFFSAHGVVSTLHP